MVKFTIHIDCADGPAFIFKLEGETKGHIESKLRDLAEKIETGAFGIYTDEEIGRMRRKS